MTESTVVRRYAWADIAKGACIVLVVLWHVLAKHYLQLKGTTGTPIPGIWGSLGESLLPLRMPVFFTVSGMFAVTAMSWPWRRLARTKLARFGYLYLLWVLIDTVVLSLTPEFPTERAENLPDLLAELTISPTNLWYLQALALYFALARTARWSRLPVPVLLAVAAGVSVVASAGLFPNADRLLAGNRVDVLQNLVFFLGGLHLRPALERFAERAGSNRLLVLGSGFGLVMLVVTAGDALSWVGVWPVCALLAVGFAVTAAALLAGTRLGAPIARLGRQTLPVYVLHMPVLAVLDLLLARPVASVSGRPGVLLAVVEPMLFTALVMASCLVLYRGLLAFGAGWLFERPTRGLPARERPTSEALTHELPVREAPTREWPAHGLPVGTRPANRVTGPVLDLAHG
jgi:uncharacterized membrane protein YcfT